MKTYWKAALYLVSFAIISSCTEQVKVTPNTYSKIFTGENSKTWKIKFWEETANGEIIDTFTIGCMSDDQFTFFANGDHSYRVVTGSNKCDAEAATINDSWDFVNASATLFMIMPVFDTSSRLPFIVQEAKKNSMVLEIFFDLEGTGSYRIHMDATDED